MSSDTLPPYVELGSGPAVVFAHGTLMDKSMFEPQMQTLSQAYRVILFDSRARTGPWDSQWKIPDLVDDTLALLNNLGIERCVLAGMSVGGFMALDFALTHPDRLDGLAGPGPGERAHVVSRQFCFSWPHADSSGFLVAPACAPS